MGKVHAKDKYLSNNPMVVVLDSEGDDSAVVSLFDTTGEEFYSSEIKFFHKEHILDISFAFVERNPDMIVGTHSISVKFTPSRQVVEKFFQVYDCGISKLLVRQLAELNTDIFKWKLKNSARNFFLTARTNSSLICIPENELLPICYFAAGMDFSLYSGAALVRNVSNIPATNADKLSSIDILQLRKDILENTGRLVSAIVVHGQNNLPACSIVITEAEESDYFIRFRNSWGVFEKKSINGLIDYVPDFTEKTDYAEFDKVINDFVRSPQKKEVFHRYIANSGYCTPDERLYMIDMFASNKCFLQVRKMEYEVRLKCDTPLLESTDDTPISVPFTIELIDSDSNISPYLDASIRDIPLQNEFGENILTETDGKIYVHGNDF